MSRRSTIAMPGLISYLPSRLPFPHFAQNITALACLFGLEKLKPRPYHHHRRRSTPLAQLLLSMRGRYQQRAPVRCNGCIASPWTGGRHRQRAPVVDIGCMAPPCSRPSNGRSCQTCSISSRRYYLWWLWRCCHRHRQPLPSHHRPRWCHCRLVLALPDVHLFLCCGSYLSRGHRRRRLFRGHHSRRHRR